MTRAAAALLVLLSVASGTAAGAEAARTAEPVRIGVLAFRGGEDAAKRWTATADYLSVAIPDRRFEIVPLAPAELNAAVGEGRIAFVLTNTGNYVDLEFRHGISRIATLNTSDRVSAGNVFGAVVFVRADRTDIRTVADLKGKSLMAVQAEGFGGFQMAWRELKKNGIDPYADLRELVFSGFPQDKVAIAVLEGRADAGTFRTDTLESMHNEGRIRMSDFRVLDRKHHPGFPFQASTRLYPEWPFSKLKGTPQDLAQEVAIALLRMPADSTAAQLGRYGGWTVPLDYSPVHELYRELRIGPYSDLGEITLADIFKQYGAWIVALAAVLAITVAWTARIEHLVARRTRELSAANARLEQEAVERRRAEADARERQAELAHVHRLNTMGEMASGFAHELNQPLAAIVNYAKGCVRRLQTGAAETRELVEAMEQVALQAARAAEIVRRVRAFIRKEEPGFRDADIDEIVRTTVGLVSGDAQRCRIAVDLQLADGLPPVVMDPIQVEQVILNLIRNAIDAIAESDGAERRIAVGTRRHGSGAIEVSVRDTGPGLPAEGPQAIFEPFVTTKADGLGLGLSISRGIVERHGGRLTAETVPGGGAVFRFTLPIADEGRHDAA